MSPADVRRVFLIGVLRVENQNVAAAQKLNQRSVLVRRNFSRLLPDSVVFRGLYAERIHTARDREEKQLSRHW